MASDRTKCPHEKCGHDAEDHGAFTCWKGCGCGFGKWDLDPSGAAARGVAGEGHRE